MATQCFYYKVKLRKTGYNSNIKMLNCWRATIGGKGNETDKYYR